MKKSKGYFPIFINLTGKRVIVYGGGTIAHRRVAALLDYGACVHLYAPQISDDIRSLGQHFPQSLVLYEQVYCPGSVAADMVLSAIDNKKVDRALYEECKKKGIPVNIASDQAMCDFFFPALAEWEEIVVGISSGGQNPKKVRWFAQKIRTFLGGLEWK